MLANTPCRIGLKFTAFGKENVRLAGMMNPLDILGTSLPSRVENIVSTLAPTLSAGGSGWWLQVARSQQTELAKTQKRVWGQPIVSDTFLNGLIRCYLNTLCPVL